MRSPKIMYADSCKKGETSTIKWSTALQFKPRFGANVVKFEHLMNSYSEALRHSKRFGHGPGEAWNHKKSNLNRVANNCEMIVNTTPETQGNLHRKLPENLIHQHQKSGKCTGFRDLQASEFLHVPARITCLGP